jgi:hypothetical protein
VHALSVSAVTNGHNAWKYALEQLHTAVIIATVTLVRTPLHEELHVVLSYVGVVHAVVAAALFSVLNGVVQQPQHLDL